MRRFILAAALFAACAAPCRAEEDLLTRGISEYRSENYEEAAETLEQYRTSDPASSMAAFYLGMARKQAGETAEAEKNLRDALRLSPPVHDAYTEIADLLYGADRLKEAHQVLDEAERKKVRPAQVAFLRGLVYTKEKNTPAAVEAFRKAGNADPAVKQAADLQIAMTYVQDRKLETARTLLQEVIRLNPGSELASFAREYEKNVGKSLAEYRSWRVSFGASWQYDDNVVAEPMRQVVDVSRKIDTGVVADFRLDYAPLLSGPLSFNAGYSAYGSFYRKLTDYNVIQQTLVVNPGFPMQGGALNLPLSYTHMFLGDEDYSGIFSVKPTATVVTSPEGVLQFTGGYSLRNMYIDLAEDERRDADIYSVGASYIHSFAGGKGVASLGAELSLDRTKGRNWVNRGHRFSASLLTPVVDGLTFNLSLDALIQDYLHRNTNEDRWRFDRTYTATAGLSWEFYPGISLTSLYAYTRAESTLPVYDYQRNVMSVGANFSF